MKKINQLNCPSQSQTTERVHKVLDIAQDQSVASDRTELLVPAPAQRGLRKVLASKQVKSTKSAETNETKEQEVSELILRLQGLCEGLLRKSTLERRYYHRALIVLEWSKGKSSVNAISTKLGVSWGTVDLWIDRWKEMVEKIDFNYPNGIRTGELKQFLLKLLKDAPRKGRPLKYTAEEYVKLLALACQPPKLSNRPISHWSARELAEELRLRKEILNITPRTIQRFFKEIYFRPHRIEYWLNSDPENQETFNQRVKVICQLYLSALELYDQNIFIVCNDEKTGIQTLQRLSPTLLPIPGANERVEHSYKRHGTLGLIATMMVATGQLLKPMIRSTRTETDYIEHINDIIMTDPTAQWIFIVDNLNTHKSESLVRLVDFHCGVTNNLGIKGRSGILKNQTTRQQFLEDPFHRIRFVFLPKHCSWLNQIECWFSILVKKLLNRTSFPTKEALAQELSSFIDYFNRTMAKPFNWTYKGKPLTI